MGVLCSAEKEKKELKKVKENEIKEKTNLIQEDDIKKIDEDIKETKEDEKKILRSAPKNIIKNEFKIKLKDLSNHETFEEQVKDNIKINELLKLFKLRENGDYIIEFENKSTINYDKINERFGDILLEIFNKNIPEVIEMNYSYIGLDIPMYNSIEAYIESNQIIGSAMLDNKDNFSIITYEKDTKKITSYNYKRKDNEDLIKFNSFTAFCNAKGKLYFSGGENDLTYDPDKTIAKYNDFFYIDLTEINENSNKLVIKELPNLVEPRTWHSMIYIPNNYIFIVGGSNTKSVEIYDMKTNVIEKDSELNELRSECSLCLVNNTYLYAFFGFLIYQEYNMTIEKCNLLKEKRVWEYVNMTKKPDLIFSPSFFGVSYFKDNDILLIGGNDNDGEKHFDYIYKIGAKEEEEKDDIEEFSCQLNEANIIFRDKFFMPIGDNKAVNIPLITGEEIKILILDTENGEIIVQNQIIN